MHNVMSIDVEDWFHPEALRGVILPEGWGQLEPRASRNVDKLLRLLDLAQVRATFFVLGWIAERQPELVQRIAAEGHEIASHGYAHHMITQQTPEGFAADLRKSLRILRSQSGQRVVGYRAPSFSVMRDTLWALDILIDHGIEYDSSIFPVHHDRYGIPGSPRAPYRVRWGAGRELWELPPVTLRLCGCTLPAAGGGYLRLLPYAYSAFALRRANAEGLPAVVYTHPWEYDTEQPRVRLSFARALRHYARIATTEAKLARLLREFQFTTCLEVLDGVRTHSQTQAPAVTPASEPVHVRGGSRTAIRRFAREARFSWDAYVDTHPRGTLFHLRGWLEAVLHTFGHTDASIYADRGGCMVGVLPLVEVPTLKGRALVSVPYGVYGGILADDPEIETALLDAARQRAVAIGAKYIEMRSREASSVDLPENDLYVTFERELPDKPEDCLGLIPRKSRAAVRNGRSKFGVHSEFTGDFSRLYDLYALNVRRLGSPTFPFRFLVELQRAFEGRIDVQNTLFEDRVVASVLTFYYKNTVIPYYSGTDDNYFFTQCSNVMYCDLMEAGVRRGYRRFDFGRSRREAGPYYFKVNMGFEPKPLHYQYVLLGLKELPRINPSNPKFALPRRIWSRLPLGVTKVVGPQLLKYIP